jgi:hypothetical protein
MADDEEVLLPNFLFRYAFFLCVKGYDLRPCRDVHNTTEALKTGTAVVVEMIPYDNF